MMIALTHISCDANGSPEYTLLYAPIRLIFCQAIVMVRLAKVEQLTACNRGVSGL
jgi:hypothetical protein